MQLLAERNHTIGTENAFKVGPHITKLQNEGHSVVRLNIGEPDFNIPEFVKDEIKRQLDKNNTHYCDPKGILPLRKAIANQMKSMRGLEVSPEQVVVFPGAKPALGFAQQIYCNPGDEVIYPSPGFPIYESFTKYVGAIPVPLHLSESNNFSFTADQLEELITPKTKLIYICFPSNPTGGVATQKEIEAIAEVILRKCDKNVRVFSDEIYEYITFDKKKHFSIASVPGMAERTIIGSGFSKTFAWTGGRVGYCVTPTIEEAEIFKTLNINYFSCVPAFNQEGAREALENTGMQDYISSCVTTLEKRRNVICEKLNQIQGVQCKIPGGAFYVFPNISKVCESIGAIEAFERLPSEIKAKSSPSTLFQMFALYYHKVAFLDRRSFGSIGADGKHYLRLSYAAEMPVLEDGARRIAAASADKSGFADYIKQGKNFC